MLLLKLKRLRLIYFQTLSFREQIGIRKFQGTFSGKNRCMVSIQKNVGVNARLFKDEDDFFDYLDHSAIFTAGT